MGIENYYEREISMGRDPFMEERIERAKKQQCSNCNKKQQHEIKDVGYAKKLLKRGKKVTRAGWNGKGIYIFLFSQSNFCRKNTDTLTPSGTLISYDFDIDDENENPIWHMGFLEGEEFYPLQDFVLLKTVKGICIPWNASQEDLQAEDYEEFIL